MLDNSVTAFPHHEDGLSGTSAVISMRDYFAAKAMHANLMTIAEFPDENWREGLAKDAWMMADAMLKARGEQP